jgi:uncharacterized protein
MNEFKTGQHDFITTFSGGKIFPTNPSPEDVKLEDIIHALSQKNRWSGHTRVPISVLEHSLLVAGVAHRIARLDYLTKPEEAYKADITCLHGMAHDFAEYILPDVCRPVKDVMAVVTNALGGPFRHVPFREFEAHVLGVIYKGLGLPEPTKEDKKYVRMADDILLATEARDLCASDTAGWKGLPLDPMEDELVPSTDLEVVRVAFRYKFGKLVGGL